MQRTKIKKWLAVMISAAALTLAFVLPVSAHPVGEAGDPNCLGMRISHGANHSPIQEGHGLTPVERLRLASEAFNEEIPNVGVLIKFIKTCPAPPDLD